MGFFSSILGGAKSSSQSGGFNALPEEIQSPYKNFGTAIDDILKGGNLDKYYRPTPLSGGEQSAIDRLYKGFTPDQAQLNSDISMQMNPFDSFVIDEINRQAGGEYSLLKQSLNEAGQFGSNRQALGANDIDLTRLNQIGGFKQSQYNKALENALSLLPGMRREDAAGALAGGSYARDIDMGTNAAGITALQQLAQALGILPTQEGSSSSKSESSGGIGGLLGSGGIGGAISGIGSLFSDRNLKENIKDEGYENGHKIYSFNYAGDDNRYIGVMADEIEQVMPDAVGKRNGFKTVDYDKIGVVFRSIPHGNS